MKQMLLLSFLFPFLSYSQLTGVEEVVQGQAFCVHSKLYIDSTLFNTSNIYVIKGTADTVWIFGTGYGDPTDIRVYRDCTAINASLQNDIRQTDSIIQTFGIAQPIINFIVPHFHLDHINQEFLYGIDSIYNTLRTKIFVHIRDFTQCTCNAYCGGFGACTVGSVFFGAPYDVPWSPPVLAQFVKLGFKTDPCDKVLKSFTSSYGIWRMRKAGTSHTPGGINLTCDSLNLKILGSESGSACTIPTGWYILPIHGDTGLFAPIVP